MPTETEIYTELNRYRDRTLEAFEDELARIVARAQNGTLEYLLRRLDIEDGLIESSAPNMRLVRRLDEIFMEQMERFGSSRLIQSFVSQFPGQLPSILETLELLSKQSSVPLPELKWTNADQAVLKTAGTSVIQALEDGIATEAHTAVSRVLFGFGDLPFSKVVAIIHDGFGKTVPHAKSLADTSMASFYRIALDRQYQKIEADIEQELRYRYSGPNDDRERPFCRHMTDATLRGESWTKHQINGMQNGIAQPKPVWLFCGGWNCRHQWGISFVALKRAMAA